jgi:surface antigen
VEASDLIAGLALVASAAAVVYARREARAAEDSAASSRRAAAAAETAVQTGQQQLELERKRLATEEAERAVATAPAFEPQRPQDAPAVCSI